MAIQTMIRSAFMRRMTSERAEVRAVKKGRRQRDKSGRPVVHYFHGVADPFSALAVQTLPTLSEAYHVDIRCHIASGAQGDYIGDGERFDRWAFQDASDIASFYGLEWPALGSVATPSEFADALSALSSAGTTLDFVSAAVRVFDSVARAAREDSDSESESDSRAKITDQWVAFERGDAVVAGNKLRKSWGHYGTGMFHFEGQWYWGLDRLRVLERRLIAEGFASDDRGVLFLEPSADQLPNLTSSDVELEYFPSLRSPYTAIGHARVLDLIERSNVQVNVRVVMPMMMRGVPAPTAKGQAIMTDAAREGRYFGSPMGRIVDPFGEPIKRAYAFLPELRRRGLLMPFVTEYLKAAWVEGVDVTREQGLSEVLQRTGCPADVAPAAESEWRDEVEQNLAIMHEHDLWGVPSFRVTGGGRPPFACWGQDRIWRVSKELEARG